MTFLAIATSETATGISLVLHQPSNNYSNLSRAIIFHFFFLLPKNAHAKNDVKHIGLIYLKIRTEQNGNMILIMCIYKPAIIEL